MQRLALDVDHAQHPVHPLVDGDHHLLAVQEGVPFLPLLGGPPPHFLVVVLAVVRRERVHEEGVEEVHFGLACMGSARRTTPGVNGV